MPASQTSASVDFANNRDESAHPHHLDWSAVQIKYKKINILSQFQRANGSENPDFQLPAAYQPAPNNRPASAHLAPKKLPKTYHQTTTQLPTASQ